MNENESAQEPLVVPAPIRILHLDDSPLDAQLVALTLEVEQERFPTTLKYVQTREEYLAALARKDFDIILSDYRMPGYDGDQALASAQEICPETPFIIVTGELGEEFAVERLQRGATDYVLKDRIFRLIPAIKRALSEAENYRKRKEAERESQKRQGELWAVIQAMHGGIMVFDPEGNVVLVNDALVPMLGYRNVAELKKTVAHFASVFEYRDDDGRLIPPEEWPVSRIMRGETIANLELKSRLKDTGRERFFSVSGQPVWDENGKQILSVLVIRDVTERKAAEEELRRAQRVTSEVLESIQDPFYSLDSRWRFTYVNAKCEQFFGRSRAEMLGQSLWEVFPEVVGSESERVLKVVATTRTPVLYETRSVIRDTWVEVHVFTRADGGISVLYRDITERKAMEQALRTRESDLSRAQKAAHLGNWRWDLRSDSVTWSEELYRIFGVDPKTFVPSNAAARELIHPEDRNLQAAYVMRALQGETVPPFESRIIRPGGEERIVTASGFDVEFDETGKPVTLHGTILDITERKKAEGALRMSEERFGAAFRRSPYPQIISRVKDGVFVNVNDATLDLYGLERDEVIGHSSFELGLLPDPRERSELVAALARDGFVKDFPMRLTTRKKGERRLLLSASLLSAGEEELMLTIVSDVTERKHAEEELKAAKERVENTLNGVIGGYQAIGGIADEVWSCDLDGKMSLVNLVAQPAMQLDEFAGKTIEQVNEEVDILNTDGTLRLAEDAPLLQALKGRIVRGEEIMHHRTTGVRRFRQYSAVPVRDAEGNIVGSVAIVRDITQAKQAEMEARQAEHAVRLLNEELEERVQQRTKALELANKELEAFSYSISHDLRSPLRLINGFADLLIRQGQEGLTPNQKESLKTIQTQVARMDELIKALLEFSRLTRKELRRVSVDTRKMVEEVVAEQRQVLGEETAKEVVVEIGDLPSVEGDPILLRMVFTNLLSNAFKFTRLVKDPTITIDATEAEGFYSFRIRDNGVGFPKGQTERLFKIFQRLHGVEEFEGTGIGLANVRKIVERHGGQVCGDGEEGKGATFFFTLPVNAPPDNASENRTSKLAV